MSSFSGHIRNRDVAGKFTLLDVPDIMRTELDMKIMDLNTSSLASMDSKYLEKLRLVADRHGCLLTNLKMNQSGLDMNSPDSNIREKALSIYKKSIDAASLLGLKWARPLPLKPKPEMSLHIDSYRELADYGQKKNVQLLVENYGWMEDDPASVTTLVKKIGHNVAACPDTGNWKTTEIRYAGLQQTFPIAVSCDFKAKALGPNGEHTFYDLQRCFEIGWEAGFRGPWCLEHANADRKTLFRELSMLRDNLRSWIAAG